MHGDRAPEPQMFCSDFSPRIGGPPARHRTRLPPTMTAPESPSQSATRVSAADSDPGVARGAFASRPARQAATARVRPLAAADNQVVRASARRVPLRRHAEATRYQSRPSDKPPPETPRSHGHQRTGGWPRSAATMQHPAPLTPRHSSIVTPARGRRLLPGAVERRLRLVSVFGAARCGFLGRCRLGGRRSWACTCSRGRRPSGSDSEAGSPRNTSSTTPARGRRSIDSDSATTRLPTLNAMRHPRLVCASESSRRQPSATKHQRLNRPNRSPRSPRSRPSRRSYKTIAFRPLLTTPRWTTGGLAIAAFQTRRATPA